MKKLVALSMSLVMVLSIFMCFSVTAFATEGVWGGAGKSEDPYVISDLADLQLLRDNVNKNGETYEGQYFVLNADITGGINFGRGIGYKGTDGGITDPVFKGNFDGQNHIIDIATSANGNNTNAGIFGYTDGAVIKNIQASVPDAPVTIGSPQHVGGIVGWAVNTTISDCTNYSSISNWQAWLNYGGIVGYCEGSTVENCTNYGSFAVNTGTKAGGIAGQAKNSSIINCKNYGTISAKGEVGGIVGYATATTAATNKIDSCVNSGNVTGGASNGAGGVVGYSNKVSVLNSANNNPVSSSASRVGGIAGEFRYDTISGCKNSGNVTGAQYTSGVVGYSESAVLMSDLENTGNITNSSTYLGGVVGRLSGTAVHLVNRGAVTTSYAETGEQCCGGVIGGMASNATLYESVNYGTVTGYNSNSATTKQAVGAVVGRLVASNGKVIDCVNYGTSDVAGIVGDSYDTNTVENCLNLGSSPYAGIYYANNSNVGYESYYTEGMTYNGVATIASSTGKAKDATAQTATQLTDGTTLVHLNDGGHYNDAETAWVQGSQYPELAYYCVAVVETSAVIDSVEGTKVNYTVTLSEDDTNAVVLIALYNGNDLVDVKTVDAAQTSYTFESAGGSKLAKIFVWDSLTTAKPIAIDEITF